MNNEAIIICSVIGAAQLLQLFTYVECGFHLIWLNSKENV